MSVLLLTSRAQEGDIDQGFAAGANDYMVKPFGVASWSVASTR